MKANKIDAGIKVALILTACFTFTAAAADTASYGVLKALLNKQTSTGPPFPIAQTPYYVSVYVSAPCADLVTNATVIMPNSTVSNLDGSSDGSFWQLFQNFTNQADQNASFPNGTYAMNIFTSHDGTRTNLSLSITDSLPPAPHFANFTAAQSVDASASFTVMWDAFAGGTTNNFVQFYALTGQGLLAFITPNPGMPGALSGTDTSVVIPTNTLSAGQTYDARLFFFANSGQLTNSSYPGVRAGATHYTRTKINLVTIGSPDTVPPFLAASTPADEATNVLLNTPIMFTFNESMLGDHDISWSSNLNTCDFVYSWSADKRTLSSAYAGALPANAVISWTLVPMNAADGFFDLAGNALASTPLSGRFTTVGEPTLSEPRLQSVSEFQFRLTGVRGQNYTIYASSNLSDWVSVLATNAPADSFVVTVPTANNSRRFYRALVWP